MEDEEHIRTVCNISFSEYKGTVQVDLEERITCNPYLKKWAVPFSRQPNNRHFG